MIAALAHELGHAFLLQSIESKELIQISDQFGAWNSTRIIGRTPSSIRSSEFFHHHPSFDHKNELIADQNHFSVELQQKNISSEYALEDIHEWFAESFAAFLLVKLGKKGLLGPNWRDRLVILPKRKNDYWMNYNNLSPEFNSWLEKRISSI